MGFSYLHFSVSFFLFCMEFLVALGGVFEGFLGQGFLVFHFFFKSFEDSDLMSFRVVFFLSCNCSL